MSKGIEVSDIRMESAYDVSRLSAFNFADQAPLWWGFWGIILIETTVFASLVAGYFYLGLSLTELPPAGVKKPELLMPTIASLVLFSSSYTMHRADKSVSGGNNSTTSTLLLVSIALATAFLVLKVIEYSNVEYRWDSHSYGSAVWAIVVFHSTHVTALILKTIVVTFLAYRGYFNKERRLGLTVNGLYWHFVVLVWLPLYLVLYWAPRIF